MIGAVLLGLALLAPYAWGVRRVRRPWPAWRTAAFAAAAGLLAFAVGGPLDAAADESLPSHMVQHLLIITVVPPLVALSAPVRLALGALPSGGRRALGRALHARALRMLALAPVAVALAIAVLMAFHLPPLFEIAASVPAVHALEHAALFWTSLLGWMVVLGVDPLPTAPGPIGRMIALMALMIPMALIGSIYGQVRVPMFAHYAHGPGALAAQQQGGDVMWIGSALVMAPASIAVVIVAMLREEARQRRREAAEGLR